MNDPAANANCPAVDPAAESASLDAALEDTAVKDTALKDTALKDAAKPSAAIRSCPSDFLVEEIPAYGASGEGEHLFVTFRKTGLTTMHAIERLAEALGVDVRQCGRAGLKDRHAVTRQTVSLPWPIARGDEATPLLANMAAPEIEVLAIARHVHKMKPGHLKGNRFTITLRQLKPEAVEPLGTAFAALCDVPNRFGAQRFGRHGDNAQRAMAWLRGEWRGPRGRGKQKLLFSALQSELFNQVLQRRLDDGTHASVIDGDLVKKYESGGMFIASSPELLAAQQRAEAGELCATGPMFGAKMRWPAGQALNTEEEIFDAAGLARLQSFRSAGAGTRRALLLRVTEREHEAKAEDGVLIVSFVLPKGGYATTVLSEICQLHDAGRLTPDQGATPPA
jgi:tRNA pseudouridine13 synthase